MVLSLVDAHPVSPRTGIPYPVIDRVISIQMAHVSLGIPGSQSKGQGLGVHRWFADLDAAGYLQNARDASWTDHPPVAATS